MDILALLRCSVATLGFDCVAVFFVERLAAFVLVTTMIPACGLSVVSVCACVE